MTSTRKNVDRMKELLRRKRSLADAADDLMMAADKIATGKDVDGNVARVVSIEPANLSATGTAAIITILTEGAQRLLDDAAALTMDEVIVDADLPF